MIYIGKCPRCNSYGMLEIVVSEGDVCVVVCDECFVEWPNPEAAMKNIGGIRNFSSSQKVRSATFEEIERAGWTEYIQPERRRLV